MIKLAFLFAAGFLSACFVALLFLPLLWRRALVLTKRQFDKALPVSKAEIAAERDALGADYAARLRKVEVIRDKAQRKSSKFMVQVEQQEQMLEQHQGTISQREAEIEHLKMQKQSLEALVGKHREMKRKLKDELERRTGSLTKAIDFIEQLKLQLTNARNLAQDRQEITDQTSQNLGQVQIEATKLRADNKELLRKLNAALAEGKAVQTSLLAGSERLRELQNKVSDQMAQIADRDQEIHRLSQQLGQQPRVGSNPQQDVVYAPETTAQFLPELPMTNAPIDLELKRRADQLVNRISSSSGSDNQVIQDELIDLASEMIRVTDQDRKAAQTAAE